MLGMMTNKINLENMFSSFVLFLMCQISKCINALYPYNYLYMCICVYVLQAFLRRTPELAGPPHIVTLFIPPLPTANLCLFSKTCLMQELSNQSLQCACTPPVAGTKVRALPCRGSRAAGARRKDGEPTSRTDWSES